MSNTDYTYICAIDGKELPDTEFPTHEQVVSEGLNPEVCMQHQKVLI